MTVIQEWRVKFCTDCFHAFDVLFVGRRTAEICEECRMERRREYNRQMVLARSAERAARRAERTAA
jgi:hypothetical protein